MSAAVEPDGPCCGDCGAFVAADVEWCYRCHGARIVQPVDAAEGPGPVPPDWDSLVITRNASCSGCKKPFTKFYFAWVHRDDAGRYMRYHDECAPWPLVAAG